MALTLECVLEGGKATKIEKEEGGVLLGGKRCGEIVGDTQAEWLV